MQRRILLRESPKTLCWDNSLVAEPDVSIWCWMWKSASLEWRFRRMSSPEQDSMAISPHRRAPVNSRHHILHGTLEHLHHTVVQHGLQSPVECLHQPDSLPQEMWMEARRHSTKEDSLPHHQEIHSEPSPRELRLTVECLLEHIPPHLHNSR